MASILRVCSLSLRKRFGILLTLCFVIILLQIYIVMRMDGIFQRRNELSKTLKRRLAPIKHSEPKVQRQTSITNALPRITEHRPVHEPTKHVNTPDPQHPRAKWAVHHRPVVQDLHQKQHAPIQRLQQKQRLPVKGYLGKSVHKANIPKTSQKTIMLYGFDEAGLFGNENKTSCGVKTCYLVHAHDIHEIQSLKADAVLFQANRLPTFDSVKHMEGKPVFVFVSMDPPGHLVNGNQATGNLATRQIPIQWKDRFNWTMTYTFDSDIPLPYGAVVPLTSMGIGRVGIPYIVDSWRTNRRRKTHNLQKNLKQLFKSKRSTVAWIQDKCSTDSKREEYVQLLQEHIEVDIYGDCSTSIERKTYNKRTIAREYKFLLLFEESLCVDYITEQVYTWFKEDIVLVLRGANTYDKQIPSNTFIDTKNFESPKKLGEYLTKTSTDENYYTAYIRRKDTYYVIKAEEVAQLALCEACKRLQYVTRYKKSMKDISVWWRKEQHCVHPHDIQPFRAFETD